MKLKKLISILEYKRLEDISGCEIKGITCNSNLIQAGYLFVAIKGKKYDGHNFITQAIDRGAKAVIIQKDLPLSKGVTKILVSDPQAALACLCNVFYGSPAKKLKVIGITGTNGKTTVSYLLESILAGTGSLSAVMGTINYRIGNKVFAGVGAVEDKWPKAKVEATLQISQVNTTPQIDILQAFLQEAVFAQAKYAIIEISSHALDQRRVEGVDFSSAIFTNLTQEHLDYHCNLDNYFSCKSILFEKLAKHSWAIINVDNAWGRKLIKKVKSKLLTFGVGQSAQIRAENIKLGLKKSRFIVNTPGAKLEIETALLGRHNVYNILAAVSLAVIEDIDASDIASGVASCLAVPGRLERIDCGQDFLLFIDYAHTEDGLKNVLQSVRQMAKDRSDYFFPLERQRGRIILVFGCGGDRDKTKRPRMGKIATGLADSVILTTDNPRSEDPEQIISDIIGGIDRKHNYQVVLDRFEAISEALSQARGGDIVIIAGKGHETGQIFAERVLPFNDREAAERILRGEGV